MPAAQQAFFLARAPQPAGSKGRREGEERAEGLSNGRAKHLRLQKARLYSGNALKLARRGHISEGRSLFPLEHLSCRKHSIES